MRGASRHRTATRRRRVVVWLAVVALCLVLVVGGAGPAAAAGHGGSGTAHPMQSSDVPNGGQSSDVPNGGQSSDSTNDTQESNTPNGSAEFVAANDTDPPEWVNATKAWPTEIRLHFSDNSSISPDSITADDFVLSTGNVTGVSVEPADGRNYTDVTVALTLRERLAVNNITVSIAANGSVADAAGNELTDGSKRVTGMDTVVPEFERFELRRINASTVEIRLAANEPLTGLELAVTGPENARLNMSDFTPVDDSNTTFRTRYTLQEYGAYSFVWERAVDRRGNFRVMSRMRQVRYDDPAPAVVIDGPERTTVDTEVTFNASATADEDAIASYRWRIDGGTVLSGESIRVAFATAGRHDITLETTDSEGHTAVETRQILVRRTVDGVVAVNVTRLNATHANATVQGTGLVQQVRTENGTLVETSNVTLNRLSAAFPSNTSVSLGIEATDRRPRSFEGPLFGLFELDHDGPANRVGIRFSVDRASLNRSGVEPDEVVLYRDADGWTPLTTSVVSRGERRVVLHATAPGLSQFAVGAEAAAFTTNGTNESSVEQLADTEPSVNESTTDRPATNDSATGQTATNESVTDQSATNQSATSGSAVDQSATNGSGMAEQSTPQSTDVPQPTGTATDESAATSGSLLPAPVAGLLAGLPNPLALWPGGLVGTVLGALVGLVVVVYGVLKALAIYLGY